MKTLSEALEIIENHFRTYPEWRLKLCDKLNEETQLCKKCAIREILELNYMCDIDTCDVSNGPDKVISILKTAIRKQKLEKLLKD